MLKVCHHSYQSFYRTPFGAVPCHQEVILRLSIQNDADVESVILRFWNQSNSDLDRPIEEKLLMEKVSQPSEINDDSIEDSNLAVYEARFTSIESPGWMWYFFILQL